MEMINRKKKVRLIEIAEKSGVSVTAVSMALANHPQISDKTKNNIQLISHELGYRPAHPPKTGQRVANSKNSAELKRIGLLLIGSKIDDEAYAGLLHDISSVVAMHDSTRIEFMAIQDIDSTENVIKKALVFASELNSLIISGKITVELIKQIQQTTIPFLVFGGVIGELQSHVELYQHIHAITSDDLSAGKLATTCLLTAGHKRIGFVCEYIAKGLCFDQWLSGYRLAHIEAGLIPDDSLVNIAGEAFMGGKPAAKYMLKMQNPPTAYVIPDSRTAASFISEMQIGGVRLNKNNIVIGGNSNINMVKKYQLEDYPQIASDSERGAQICIQYLLQMTPKTSQFGVKIVLPLITHNLPVPLQNT